MNMLKRKLHSKILLGAVLISSFTSCVKTNNIGQDNDSVIQTPHTVLAGSEDGWIVKTNDGRTFNSMFPPDGRAIEMISAAGPNVLMLKSRLFLSDNGGQNFNPVSYTDYNAKPWREWVLDCAGHNRTYMASKIGNGVAYSADSGRTWQSDLNWQANTSPNLRITSFAQLTNGAVFAFNDEFNVLYRRDGVENPWNAVTIQGVYPAASAYFMVANNTELFIVDHNGFGGSWYSTNEGVEWTKHGIGELPVDGSVKFVGAGSSYMGKLAVATEKDVYYATRDRAFVKANTGLDSDTKVYSITTKYNRYKGGSYVSFLYLATSKGIYRSDDGGFSWDKVTFNEYNKAYTAIY